MSCCFGRRKRSNRQSTDNSTLVGFPARVRKLTIDHGRVVTAPPSPSLSSFFGSTRWPGSGSTKRDSHVTVLNEKGVEVTRPTTTTSSIMAGPPSPSFSTFSFAPSVMRQHAAQNGSRVETGSTRRTSIRKPVLESMAEAPDAVPAVSRPVSSLVGTDSDSRSQVSFPEPAVTSERVLSPSQHQPRKASLGAISNAALGMDGDQLVQMARIKTAPSSRHPMTRVQTAPVMVPKIDSLGGGSSPRPAAMRSATTKGVLSVENSDGTGKKERKHRPPPITTSRAPPKIPTAFLRAPESSSTIVPSPLSQTTASPGSPPTKSPGHAEMVSRMARQSVFSVTSSQYSPTFSIHPVNQVQVVQATQVQQVKTRAINTRLPPSTGTRLEDVIASPPSVTPSPKAFFPPNYSGTGSPAHTSLAGMVANDAGSATASSKPGTTSRTGSKAGSPAKFPASAPTSPEVPLTSASLNFPPNFPDYSYLPKEEPAGSAKWSRKGSKGSNLSSDVSSLPEVVAEESETEVHEMAGSGENGTIVAKHTSKQVEVSLKNVGIRGTATVTISELQGVANLEKARETAKRV